MSRLLVVLAINTEVKVAHGLAQVVARPRSNRRNRGAIDRLM